LHKEPRWDDTIRPGDWASRRGTRRQLPIIVRKGCGCHPDQKA